MNEIYTNKRDICRYCGDTKQVQNQVKNAHARAHRQTQTHTHTTSIFTRLASHNQPIPYIDLWKVWLECEVLSLFLNQTFHSGLKSVRGGNDVQTTYFPGTQKFLHAAKQDIFTHLHTILFYHFIFCLFIFYCFCYS